MAVAGELYFLLLLILMVCQNLFLVLVVHSAPSGNSEVLVYFLKASEKWEKINGYSVYL
jgi:hypothetical protein